MSASCVKKICTMFLPWMSVLTLFWGIHASQSTFDERGFVKLYSPISAWISPLHKGKIYTVKRADAGE